MANINLEMLKLAVSNLGELAHELVFIGGCTTGLFITDEAAADVRSTNDVDVIVEAVTYSQYIKFEERLQKAHFQRDLEKDAPMCRWKKNDTVLDLLPVNGDILGFSNSWYNGAVMSAELKEIDNDVCIKVIAPAYFLATKLEAFADRGKNDFMASRDIEDIISVIDGRPELYDEILAAEESVRSYIASCFRDLMLNRKFLDALPGHLLSDAASQERARLIIERLTEITRL